MSIGTVRCQSSSLPLPKHRGKEKPAGTAMPAGFPLSGEILVTHGSANVRSIGQALAIGKPYFISRKVFSTRSSTSTRLNASPLRNLAHVRMICNVTRARSSFLHGLAGGFFIRVDGLPSSARSACIVRAAAPPHGTRGIASRRAPRHRWCGSAKRRTAFATWQGFRGEARPRTRARQRGMKGT